MMPYRFSYPLYLDVSEHKKIHLNRSSVTHNLPYQRDENGSPPDAFMNLNALYDSVLASGHAAMALLNGRSHTSNLPFHNYLNSQHFQRKKYINTDTTTKSPFSIEAILGLNTHQMKSNNCLFNDVIEHEFDFIKEKDDSIKINDDIREKGCNYFRTNNIASVSPDSTAKEQIIYKPHKSNKHVLTNSSSTINSNSSHKRDISDVDSGEMNGNKYLKTSHKIDLHQKEAQNTNANSNQNGKLKRVRTIFTPEQLEKLETEFERQQYMVGPERLYLASALNLTEAQVKVWFQNRRIKHRKQFFEKEQALIAHLRTRSDDSGQTTDEDPNHDEDLSNEVDRDQSFAASTDATLDVTRKSPLSYSIHSPH